MAVALIALVGAGARAATTIALSADQSRIEVTGLAAADLASLQGDAATADVWARVLVVHVASDGNTGPTDTPPVMGTSRVDGDRVVFAPRFSFRAGLSYRVAFDAGAIPAAAATSAAAQRVETVVSLPKPHTEPTTVAAVYPSGDELPENLLKFYIQFSAPMDRGESYQHIHILDADDREVPYAFLRLHEELWSPDRRRFTLLFDPGRIKRGLKPHEDEGLPLVEGRQYTLAIDAAWRDAQGEPLQSGFRKPFRVVAPDDKQPDPHAWKITPPKADTRGDLVVTFDEPLDHALAERMIFVGGAQRREIDGEIRIDAGETRWSFSPAKEWATGQYELVVDGTLEDRAGNSPGRPFEVANATEEVGVTTVREVVVPFEIAAAR